MALLGDEAYVLSKNYTKTRTFFVEKTKVNLWNGEYLLNTYINSSTGALATQTGTRTTKKMPCKPNTYYTLSGENNRNVFRFEDADGTYITHIQAATVLSPPNASYMYVYYSIDGDKEIQIQEGREVLEYVPPNGLVVDASKFNVSRLPRYIITDGVSGNYESGAPYINYSAFSSNVDNVYAIYDVLVDAYPDYVTKTLLGTETSGLPIYRYDFAPPPVYTSGGIYVETTFPKILHVVGVHGMEKWSVANAARFYTDLCDNWKTNDVLRMLRWNVHFIVIPSLNPYGFNNNQRKNANGVDLNRNFPVRWQAGSNPSDDNYPGSEPLSEIESQLVANLLQSETDILFTVDHHNHSSLASSGYACWLGYTNDRMKRLMLGLAGQITAKIKAEYSFVDQSNSSLCRVSNQNQYRGTLQQYSEQLGISSVLLESPTGISGTQDQLQQFGTDVLGDLILNLVRYQSFVMK